MSSEEKDKKEAAASEQEQKEASPSEQESSEKEEAPKKASAEEKQTARAKAAPKKQQTAPKPWVNFFPPRPAETAVPEVVHEKKPVLLLAEFDSPARLLHAAERVRDAGYTRWDTHSPFPIHGMDGAMGLPDSKLGWIVLAGGLTGLTTAVTMIWWMNGIDYPLIIGGKPPFSIAPSVPIMFELTVLFSAFSAVFGMFHLNRIPQHYHPIFNSDRFRGATDDKFYISVEVEDPKYHPDRTRALLEKLHPTHIELVEETETKVIGDVEEEDH
jgi:hypothetical protein